MLDAPTNISEKQLKDIHISVIDDKKSEKKNKKK